MAESEKVGAYDFQAGPFHVDLTGHLTIPVLGNHILNVAGQHAAARGFGIAELNEEQFTWVLSRLTIELKSLPLQYERFSIRTWVESIYRFFTNRNFEIVDVEGQPIGWGRSVWAMISTTTRQPADLMKLHGDRIADYVDEKTCPIEKPSRIKVTSTEPVLSHVACYSDIDINNHVNSIKYIEHILDLFPVRFYQHRRLRRFEIAYVQESYYGQKLSFFIDEPIRDEQLEYQVELRNEAGEAICRSKLFFE